MSDTGTVALFPAEDSMSRFLVGRDRNGMGWVNLDARQSEGRIKCGNCGKTITIGYISRDGRQKRCLDCVAFLRNRT